MRHPTRLIKEGGCLYLSMDTLHLNIGVSYRSKHMPAIERQRQLHLNIIKDWADNNGLKKMFYLFGTPQLPSLLYNTLNTIIIPIAKPGKDSKVLNRYRPIELISCVCKTMEEMINNCLVWFLESSLLIMEAQSGFRKTRSTMDHLVRFATFVREGFLNGEHVMYIF